MIKQWLISVAGVLSAIAVIFMSGKRRGTQQAEAKQNETTIKNIQIATQTENEIAAMSDVERKRLREKWTPPRE